MFSFACAAFPSKKNIKQLTIKVIKAVFKNKTTESIVPN